MIPARKERGFIRTTELLLCVAILAGLSFAIWYQNRRLQDTEFRVRIYEQRIVLPPSETLKFLTLGYDNIYADWLWLQSIQFFGSGWQTEDGTTQPIYQFFDTMTDIDPHFISAYRFGNLIIGDQRGDHNLGQDLLRKGIHKNPMSYELPYLAIYNAIWNANNPDEARWFATRLRRIPHAPEFMKRMEEYIERRAGRFDIAFEFNVRYFLRYTASRNDIERDIAERRMRDLMHRQYMNEFRDAIVRYLEDHGEHPRQMEDLLDPRYLQPFEAPTISAFANAVYRYADDIDRLSAEREVPEALVERIVSASRQRIAGLPPEPYGTWYYISTPSLDYYTGLEQFDIERWDDVPYIWTGKDALDHTNQVAISAQRAILGHYYEYDEKPSDEDIAEYLGRDPLGGRYVYERDSPESEYGVFYSTGARRVSEGREPRLGVAGPGPFPFNLEPQLSDHVEEMEWGLAQGYILPDGTEIWIRPGDEVDDQPGIDAVGVPGIE